VKIINAIRHAAREVFVEVQSLCPNTDGLEFLSIPCTVQSSSARDGPSYVCSGETLFGEMDRQSEGDSKVPNLDRIE
jgi:hypothetical protein